MLVAGDLIHYEDFVFYDGTAKNKYFIVLHGDPCLLLITTSQPRRFPDAKEGCNVSLRTFLVPANHHPEFSKPTYVVLPKVYEVLTSDIERRMAGGQVSKRQGLANKLFFALRQCLSQFREDISDDHWDVIFSPKAASATELQALADKFRGR